MAKVEILEVVEQPDGDGLLVRGTVEGYVVDDGSGNEVPEVFVAQVWKSHLYGDHKAINAQRAKDAKAETAGSAAAARELDSPETAQDVEIPALTPDEHLSSDKARREYLAGEIVAAAQAARSSDEHSKLTGSVSL